MHAVASVDKRDNNNMFTDRFCAVNKKTFTQEFNNGKQMVTAAWRPSSDNDKCCKSSHPLYNC